MTIQVIYLYIYIYIKGFFSNSLVHRQLSEADSQRKQDGQEAADSPLNRTVDFIFKQVLAGIGLIDCIESNTHLGRTRSEPAGSAAKQVLKLDRRMVLKFTTSFIISFIPVLWMNQFCANGRILPRGIAEVPNLVVGAVGIAHCCNLTR